MAVTGGLKIGGAVDAEHARHAACRLEIERPDDAVRITASHHHGVSLASDAEIVGVAALAAQQGRILLARHRLADAEFHEGQLVDVSVHCHDRHSSSLTARAPVAAGHASRTS
jgi:hypothetical protein